MPTGEFNHPLFGLVKFKTKSSTWVRGDPITFTAGFETGDVTNVIIPQLKNIPGANGGKIRFHRRGHKQLLAVFEDIEQLGLMKHIKTSAGAFFPRLRKPISGALSKLPSNHSFGIAIDLNADDGSNGATVAPVFQAHGFHWGKSFNDPMHFEVEKLIDEPKSSVRDVKVGTKDKDIDVGAKKHLRRSLRELEEAEEPPESPNRGGRREIGDDKRTARGQEAEKAPLRRPRLRIAASESRHCRTGLRFQQQEERGNRRGYFLKEPPGRRARSVGGSSAKRPATGSLRRRQAADLINSATSGAK